MTASATIAATDREIRRQADSEGRTGRVRVGRANAKREAINASLGYNR